MVVAALLVLGACSEATTSDSGSTETAKKRVAEGDSSTSTSSSTTTAETSKSNPDEPTRVDPRKGGFEITLGEWAVTPEAPAIRPGPVTFVIRNRGTMAHGFEIELEGDSSGSGSGDLFKAESELLQPGETTRLSVTLSTGVHKIECLVDGHDDMGMEGPLDVRANAPLVKEKGEQPEGLVSVSEFAFDPTVVKVDVGTEVEWRNDDPSAHTVTSVDGDFDSGDLDPKESFSFTFKDPGTYPYICNIHPDMEGTVKVE